MSILHLLYHRRQREATTGRSSGFRIILLVTPSRLIRIGSGIVMFVPGYSGGSAPCLACLRNMDSLLSPAFLRENYL